MRKTTISLILATLSVAFVCACLCITPFSSEAVPDKEQVYTAPLTVAPALDETETETVQTVEAEPAQSTEEVQKTEYTAQELEARFTSMLNMNYCYGTNFEKPDMMAACSAVSLMDYAADIHGYGIGVNRELVIGFAQSFYGVDLSEETLASDDSPEGYVMTPACEVGTQVHTVLSVIETEQGFEVLSTVRMYYGGDDSDICLAQSVFAVDSESEFGFNLISCGLV